MVKAVVSDEHRFILDRAAFELGRAIQNAAFMMDRHFKDVDDVYIKSGLYKKLMAEVEEKFIENMYVQQGVACIMANDGHEDIKKIPKAVKYDMLRTSLMYSLEL